MADNPEELFAELERLKAQVAELERKARLSESEKLLASNSVHRLIVDALPGGIVHVAADGAILAANAAALRHLGMSYDALSRRYTRDFEPETLFEDGTPCATADYPASKALASGEPQPPVTIGVRRPDGEIAWAICTAVPVLEPGTRVAHSAIVTFLDISALRRADAALRESEALLRSVVTSTPFPIGTVDRDGKIVFLSHTVPGVAHEDVVGRPAWEFLLPRDQSVQREAIARVLATGQSVHFEVTARSGTMYEIWGGPLRDGERIVGVTMLSRNITEQKKLEARVAVTDRMAAIGTLAAGVAHEINNPLTYLLANLAGLRSALGAGSSPKLQAQLEAATEGAERIRAVVSDLRSFSHTGETQLVSLDLRPMLESALRMAHSHIHVRARVVRELGPVPKVRASDSRLGQVFLNLVVNAAQAIAEGAAERNEIRVVTRTGERGHAIVEISDTGVGIEPELRERIFDPFVTTKPRGIGTGLGLYVCRNIVSSLGGELEVESTPGKGSTFRVVLPGETAVPAFVAPGLPGLLAPPAGLRVLVADDEPAIGRVLQALLADHEVTVVSGGRAALEMLCAREFDVALCDLVMPDLGGAEVYEQLRRLRPGAEERVLFMTGGAFTEHTRRFVERTPSRVLAKPFTREELLSMMARHYAALSSSSP